MPATPDQPNTFDLAEAHALGGLKGEQIHALDQLLLNDAEARDQYVLAIDLMSMVHDEVRRREEAGEMYAAEPLLKDYNAIFAELLRMEQSADPILVRQEKPRRGSGFDFRDTADALRYVAARPVVWGPIAAILLIAVALTFMFTGEGTGTATTTPPLASGTGAEPIADDPSPIVATLTAEYDVAWDRQPEQDLRAGQRFTLTQGFAEITTKEGAVAILQAPCTIKLIDSNNALRLIRGKLVGICETESSKGFLVRTRHLDVTDLGTRFGIDATRSGTTEVHVLEGEVEVVSHAAPKSASPTRLVAGESARVAAGQTATARIDHDTDRFAALLPDPNPLTGTGLGLADSDTASDWQIVAVNGQPLDSPGAMKVSKRADGTPWITAGQKYPQQANDETTFTVQTRFDLPNDVDGSSSILLLQFDANDRVTKVRLNGRAFTPPANSKDDGHDGMHTMRIAGPLLKDGNTLQLDVVDVSRANKSKWELRAAWSIPPAQAPSSEVSQ